MSSSVNTVGHRVPPFVINGLVATGNSQATAFSLSNSTYHEFTTVASGSGAILPAPLIPSPVTIFNNTATTLLVYPPVGGTINDGTVNASVSLAAGTGVQYWASSASNWYNTQTPGTSESGGTPGGTNGQIQYDNGGSFGGFTANGDATINTLTGAVTVVSTNGTAFAASATTNTTNASNITSGTLPVAQLPTSGVLPTSLTAAGVIPAGAFPATISNFTLPSAGRTRRLTGPIYTMTGAGTAVTAASFTSIFAGATANGTLTIQPDTIAEGQTIRIRVGGPWGCSSSTPSINGKLLFGGSTLSVGGSTNALAAAVTNGFWINPFLLEIFIASIGSSGTAYCYGNLSFYNTGATTAGTLPLFNNQSSGTTLSGSPIAINTTVSNLIDLQFEWSATNAANTLQATFAYVEVIG